MPVTDSITSLSTGTYTIVRQDSGAYSSDGRYVSGPSALTFADLVIEAVDFDEDTLTITGHGLETGDGPAQVTTLDTLPGGLALATDYWIVVIDDDTISLATSLANALLVPTPTIVDLLDAGVDEHTLVDTADTLRQNATTFSIVASVQPDTGRELQQLAEAEHCDEIWSVWTKTELRSRTANNEPDVVTIEGDECKVIRVKFWRGFGTSHWQAWAARTKAESTP